MNKIKLYRIYQIITFLLSWIVLIFVFYKTTSEAVVAGVVAGVGTGVAGAGVIAGAGVVVIGVVVYFEIFIIGILQIMINKEDLG